MSRDPLRLPDYLEHILEAIGRIHSYCRPKLQRRGRQQKPSCQEGAFGTGLAGRASGFAAARS
jgi:hypothetical protein